MVTLVTMRGTFLLQFRQSWRFATCNSMIRKTSRSPTMPRFPRRMATPPTIPGAWANGRARSQKSRRCSPVPGPELAVHFRPRSGFGCAFLAAAADPHCSIEARRLKVQWRNACSCGEFPWTPAPRGGRVAHFAAAYILTAIANDLCALAGLGKRNAARGSLRRVSSVRDSRCRGVGFS